MAQRANYSTMGSFLIYLLLKPIGISLSDGLLSADLQIAISRHGDGRQAKPPKGYYKGRLASSPISHIAYSFAIIILW
jgi:hypothetical protein